MAKWISGFPINYYPWWLHSAAIRFKNSLQENAKTHVFAEDIIESSHNGIVAWEKRSKIKPILIMGKGDYIKGQNLYNNFNNWTWSSSTTSPPGL